MSQLGSQTLQMHLMAFILVYAAQAEAKHGSDQYWIFIALSDLSLYIL